MTFTNNEHNERDSVLRNAFYFYRNAFHEKLLVSLTSADFKNYESYTENTKSFLIDFLSILNNLNHF